MKKIDYLKINKRSKREVSKILGISKKQVKELVYNLLEHAEANGWQVTEASCETWASLNTDSMVYKILDWGGTQAERQALLKDLLDYLTFVISKDNKIYTVEEVV